MRGPSIIIEVKSLRKIYPGKATPAIRDISFNIYKGEIFGLLGPNGAGKTTIISILCGLKEATSGNVQITGINYDQHREAIKQQIGVVPQDIALYPKLTALENLRFFGNMYGLRGSSLKQRIVELLEQFGLQDYMHHQISTFSGGMKRRINLIAGILHHPKILFLDEPTVGIDVHSRDMIMSLLKSLHEEGMTIIYTSHHMDEAQHFCSHIAIIDHGSMVVEGKPFDLIEKYKSGNLEKLFLQLTGRNVMDEC